MSLVHVVRLVVSSSSRCCGCVAVERCQQHIQERGNVCYISTHLRAEVGGVPSCSADQRAMQRARGASEQSSSTEWKPPKLINQSFNQSNQSAHVKRDRSARERGAWSVEWLGACLGAHPS
jgi:hypothetical protein